MFQSSGLYLGFEGEGISMSFKSSFGALEDAGGSSLGFGILILIWIWSLVFGTPICRILALYLDFEGAKDIHVLYVLLWGFGGRWRFLTGVWHPDNDLFMVIGLLLCHVMSFVICHVPCVICHVMSY